MNVSLPYITTDLSGIGGQLHTMPDYFVVQEIPLYEPQGEGQHLYVRLTKVGQTTKDVQRQLERLFDLKKREVAFAGMKDKDARTTQTFSLSLGHMDATAIEDARQRIQDRLSVEVHWAKLHKNKLRTGHLLGNRFVIRITHLDVSGTIAEQRAKVIAERLQHIGVPNFFGPQRFGQDGANAERGLAILMGDRGPKDRWLRRFLISSYQSFLCNQYLTKRIEQGAFEHLLQGDIAKKHETGGLFDVEDLETEQARYLAHEISFTAPIYGPKMREAKSDAAQLEATVLANSNITLGHFNQAKIVGTRRLGRLLVPDLMIKKTDQDSLEISFSLPKGAFATTLLREFMKQD